MKSIGRIGWIDITADNANELKSFYEKVVGWKMEAVSMGDYSDYNVHPKDSEDPIAGICHKKGENSDIPTGWMIYINVDDLDRSLEAVESDGGQIVRGARSMGSMGKMAIIRDPAGAISCLFEHAKKDEAIPV